MSRAKYNVTYEEVSCPLFGGELVFFKSDGFYHATHNGRGMARDELEQRTRLNLLTFIPEIIANAKEFGAKEKICEQIINGKLKIVTYYRIRHQVKINGEEYRIAVILRRIGAGGKLRYFSVFCEGAVSKKAE